MKNNLKIFKGVVWSKISSGYVKVDGLGVTMLFTRSKSDNNWPRTSVSNMQISHVLKNWYPGKIFRFSIVTKNVRKILNDFYKIRFENRITKVIFKIKINLTQPEAQIDKISTTSSLSRSIQTRLNIFIFYFLKKRVDIHILPRFFALFSVHTTFPQGEILELIFLHSGHSLCNLS